MLRFANVATPACAATDVVPERLAPLAPVPGTIATPTVALDVVTVLPNASRTATWGFGVRLAPALPFAGDAVTASAVAAPGLPVAVNVTGEPEGAALLAATLFAPAVLPNVSVADARPSVSLF